MKVQDYVTSYSFCHKKLIKNEMGSVQHSRLIYADYARVLAIISITMNHAISRSFDISSCTFVEFSAIPLAWTIIKGVLYVFSRLGVPLFLMISGVLLLDRDYSDEKVLKKFIKNNWFSLFITTEIWLFIMYWSLTIPYLITGDISIIKALIKCIANQCFLNQVTMGSMWYMPMILCVYLSIPIMSVALKHIKKSYFYAVIGIVILSSMIIPTCNKVLLSLDSTIQLDFKLQYEFLFSHYWSFILLGYFSKEIFYKISTIKLVVCCIATFFLTAAFQIWIYASPIDYAIRYQDFGVLLTSAMIFELLRRKDLKENLIIKDISAMSFGIYFVHIMIMTFIDHVIAETVIYFSRFIILWVASFVGSIFIIKFLSKVSICKKYLFRIMN